MLTSYSSKIRFKSLLKRATPSQLKIICEIVLNTLTGNIPTNKRIKTFLDSLDFNDFLRQIQLQLSHTKRIELLEKNIDFVIKILKYSVPKILQWSHDDSF